MIWDWNMFGLPITRLRKIGLFTLIILFLLTGLSHFNYPDFYVSVVPPYLPLRHELAYISGFLEIIGAIALLFSKTRRIAGFGLISLLIVIFPANIHMALHPDHFPSCVPLIIYLRLPLHLLLILWVYWAALRKKAIGYQI